MKYKTFLWFETNNPQTTLYRNWLVESGIEVLSRFSKLPMILVNIDEDDLNFIRLASPFGKVVVYQGPLKDISGAYVNEPNWNKLPTDIWSKDLENIETNVKVS